MPLFPALRHGVDTDYHEFEDTGQPELHNKTVSRNNKAFLFVLHFGNEHKA